MSATAPRPVVVADNPATHPYIEHIRPARAGAWVRWADPAVPFWEPAALAGAGVDVAHLHFGFELRTPEELERWADGLRAEGIALVHTVHDLANPHLVDQAPFEDLVGALVRRADGLITLTPGAADEVETRWGRRPEVIAHPHVHPHPGWVPVGAPRPWAAVVNLGQLRPNLDLAAVEQAAQALSQRGGLLAHVTDEAVDRADEGTRARLDALAAAPGVRLTQGPLLTDDELWDRLAGARVVLLPYRWGTHSGMAEAAHDCGAVAVASDVGFFADQGAITFPPGQIAATLDRVLHAPAPVPVSAAQRAAQRAAIAGDHESLYRRVADPVQ